MMVEDFIVRDFKRGVATIYQHLYSMETAQKVRNLTFQWLFLSNLPSFMRNKIQNFRQATRKPTALVLLINGGF